MRFVFLTQLPFSRYPSSKRATGMGEGLARLGHEVFIAAMDCEENRRRIAFEAPGCIPAWFPEGNALREAVSKVRILHRLRPDYAYAPTYGLRNLLGLRRTFPRNTKFILELNELYSVFARHRRFWKTAERIGLAECDVQVCASRMLEKHAKCMCAEEGLTRKIVYSPYAYPPYLGSRERRSTKTKTIVFMAALYRDYGIHDVLAAVRGLIEERLDVALKIVGTGPELEASRAYVAKWSLGDRIELPGFVPEEEIDSVFSRADAFIAPMRDTLQDRYRCPSKIFYYIAYGKPIVTCRIGTPCDVLSGSGFYYEPGDAGSMKDAIRRALSADGFAYPDGFVQKHSWVCRARELVSDLQC